MGDSGGDDTIHETPDRTADYEVVLIGSPMEENWFIALHSVATGNDLNAMSEQSVKEFVEKSIVYTVEDKPTGTETTTTGTIPQPQRLFMTTRSMTRRCRKVVRRTEAVQLPPTEPPAATKILKIRYLSPSEFMDYYSYSDADRNWVQLMVQTLQQGTSVAG